MAPHPETDIRTRHSGDALVVTVVGAIDVATAPELDEAVMQALAEGPRALTVDLRRANHFDSSGVRVLVRAMRHCRTSGVALSLCLGQGSGIRKVLELSGMVGALPVVSDC